jgi:1-acyl-sn-glycerol-3-phosphate acyltransferase
LIHLRRLFTITAYFIAWMLWLACTPVWFTLAIFTDCFHGSQWVALRSAAVVTTYLTCEVLGITASGGLWLWQRLGRIDAERWTDLHFRLQAWWGTTLFRAVVHFFGLRVEIEGADDADLGHGPYLLLVRHTSSGDTLLASAIVCGPHRFRMRYVLKREYLWDPCLDIVGNRVPNAFVDRFSDDSAREVRRLQEISQDLASRDGILIYPEGTRFSPEKRKRVLDRLREKGDVDMLAYAESLPCVLPPRLGGTLGILEVAPDADVVVCSHAGFEGAASLAEIWNGALINRVIRVRFRRIPHAEIPETRDARVAWLLEEWRRVGTWVENNQSASTALSPSPSQLGSASVHVRATDSHGLRADGYSSLAARRS